MEFFQIYLQAFGLIVILSTMVWLISIPIKNVSIVDVFWGIGFVVACAFYFYNTEGLASRKLLIMSLVTVWGLRLSLYIGWRNYGKGEDFRYQQFRKDYGPERYWWFSFFQVFLLQGTLIWIISSPLLAAQFYGADQPLGWLDYVGVTIWVIGFIFEAGGDFQMAKFKANPDNKGKLLNTGFWRYTRHPNYFGDATVWWGYSIFSFAAGSFWPIIAPILMTGLILKVSGVSLLERTLKNTKPEYKKYIESTSAFFPWFPKK
jgi:steroid 5-alpha reductase family enzyme